MANEDLLGKQLIDESAGSIETIGKGTANEVSKNLGKDTYYFDSLFQNCKYLKFNEPTDQVKFLFAACGVYNKYYKTRRGPNAAIDGRSTEDFIKYVIEKLNLNISGVQGKDLITIFHNRPSEGGLNMDKGTAFQVLLKLIDKVTISESSKLLQKAKNAEKEAEKTNGKEREQHEKAANKYRTAAGNVSSNIAIIILNQLKERFNYKEL